MSISNLSHSLASSQVTSDSSVRLSKLEDQKKSTPEASQSSFLGDLSSFLGNAISGGLTVASVAGSLAIPGVSKLGEAAAVSLLNGFMSSKTPNTASEMGSPLDAVSGDSGLRMMAQQVYQYNQLISSPGARFLATA
ncbi:hypothetical protein [Polynucleobacter sp. CS-Odin-A6]|uniref:hypothetical protein n=1 Tax=Polynucleobacter sp. CS-Odin-A6 TaxID=2689106 RepID=UPI001C0DF0F8|nr:hypothetical protein [Polynucleobacter sp. CS-Odin-A6]MBU3621850.1 hypothetical protein [Polynucleobacter sp. CS-Odin-A6]